VIWQPMDTAPDDDRDVLLWKEKFHEFFIGSKHVDGNWWGATSQTGLERLEPDMWAEIEYPVKK